MPPAERGQDADAYVRGLRYCRTSRVPAVPLCSAAFFLRQRQTQQQRHNKHAGCCIAVKNIPRSRLPVVFGIPVVSGVHGMSLRSLSQPDFCARKVQNHCGGMCVMYILYFPGFFVFSEPSEHRLFHGPENVLIPGTAAKVSGHHLADLIIGKFLPG